MHDARDAEDTRLIEAGEVNQLLATYFGTIVERCRAKIRDGDADEVAQRVLERLFFELKSGKRYPVPFRVVVHKVIEWKRKEHYSARRDGELPGDWEEPGPDEYEEFEQRYDLERRLARLPGRQREVAELRYLHGLEIDEIAERLQMTRNAVDQALHRAHARLREELDGG